MQSSWRGFCFLGIILPNSSSDFTLNEGFLSGQVSTVEVAEKDRLAAQWARCLPHEFGTFSGASSTLGSRYRTGAAIQTREMDTETRCMISIAD
jgi:hypothetical protein